MRQRKALLCALVGLLLVTPAVVSAQINLLTSYYDGGRTGANLSEKQLTVANVNATNFGKLWSYTVDGAVYAQPLYMQGMTINGGVYNVLYVATMNDKLYAFDADNSNSAQNLLWCLSFTSDTSGGCNNPSGLTVNPGTSPIPMEDILPRGDPTNYNIPGNIGILSTPVIDDNTFTMYLVVRTKEAGNPCAPNFLGSGSYCQRLHAIDIQTGAEKLGGPATIAGAVPGIGAGSAGGTITFDPAMGNQRPGLALVYGQIFIAWASHEDSTPNYHGWVMSYNASTLSQTGIYCTSPNLPQGEGGIWQWGRGPAVDSAGDVVYQVGNGSWNGTSDLGDSIVRFSALGGLELVDYFTPSNQATLNGHDLDLGSSGPMMIPGTSLLVGAGKSSIFYLLDNGGPYGGVEADPPPIQDLVVNNNIFTNFIKGGPVYWNHSTNPRLYIWPENDVVKAFHFNGTTFDDGGTIPATPLSMGTILAPGGNAGGDLTLSANGSKAGTGILWASIPTNADADVGIHAGTLRAFNADDLTTEIWDSDQSGTRDSVGNWAKSTPPTVVSGRVYVPSQPSSPTGPFASPVSVYGLFDFSLSATAVTDTVRRGGTATYTINTLPVYPGGFPSNVTYTVKGAPLNSTATISPGSGAVPGSATLSVVTTSTTPHGVFTLKITATGGIRTQRTSVTMAVNP